MGTAREAGQTIVAQDKDHNEYRIYKLINVRRFEINKQNYFIRIKRKSNQFKYIGSIVEKSD